jgi:hypothetical protein
VVRMGCGLDIMWGKGYTSRESKSIAIVEPSVMGRT